MSLSSTGRAEHDAESIKCITIPPTGESFKLPTCTVGCWSDNGAVIARWQAGFEWHSHGRSAPPLRYVAGRPRSDLSAPHVLVPPTGTSGQSPRRWCAERHMEHLALSVQVEY
jgi:hypothetical protein